MLPCSNVSNLAVGVVVVSELAVYAGGACSVEVAVYGGGACSVLLPRSVFSLEVVLELAHKGIWTQTYLGPLLFFDKFVLVIERRALS